MNKLLTCKNSITIVILLIVVSYCSVLIAADNKILGKEAIDFVLEDQFSKEHNWSKYKGKPVVILLCDREGSKYVDNWSKPLFEKYGKSVEFVAIADVSAVPFFLKGFIRGKFRDKYQNPILMDWDGETVEYYDIAEDVTTFICVDKKGIVRSHFSGKGSADDLTKAHSAVQSIIR